MLVIGKPREIKVNVKIVVPGDFGENTEADFDMTVLQMGATEVKSLIQKEIDMKADIAAGKVQEEDAEYDFYDQSMREKITNIDGLQSPDGTAIPFGKDVMAQMLDTSYIHNPMFQRFMDVQLNRAEFAEMKAKN